MCLRWAIIYDEAAAPHILYNKLKRFRMASECGIEREREVLEWFLAIDAMMFNPQN